MQISPRGLPRGDLAYSRNRELRISSGRLGNGFFGCFVFLFQNQKSWIFRIFDHGKNSENPTSSASIERLWPQNHAHLVDLEKTLQTCGIETSVRPNASLVFNFYC